MNIALLTTKQGSKNWYCVNFLSFFTFLSSNNTYPKRGKPPDRRHHDMKGGTFPKILTRQMEETMGKTLCERLVCLYATKDRLKS